MVRLASVNATNDIKPMPVIENSASHRMYENGLDNRVIMEAAAEEDIALNQSLLREEQHQTRTSILGILDEEIGGPKRFEEQIIRSPTRGYLGDSMPESMLKQKKEELFTRNTG